MAPRMDMTEFDAALKALYPESRIVDMTYKSRPLLALLNKKEDCGGKYAVVSIKYGNPQGRSAVFSTAQTNKTASKLDDFLITYSDDFGVVSVDGKVIEASRGQEKAFMEALDEELGGIYSSLANSAESALYRFNSGSIGVVGTSGISTVYLTLSNPEDVVNFEVGQEIAANDSDDATSARSGTATITAINRQTGVLTTDSNWTSQITSLTDGDFLFVSGDMGAKMSGLMDWMPYYNLAGSDVRTAKLAASFYGQTRTTDTTRQGGCYCDGSEVPIEEALIEAEKVCYREGGLIDYFLMHSTKFAQLKKALGSKVTYVDVKVTPTISFKGIEMYGMGGQLITILADRWCPSKMTFGIQLDTWKLYSIGKLPHWLSLDGLKILRESSANAYEARVGYYANLGCKAPAYNVNCYLG